MTQYAAADSRALTTFAPAYEGRRRIRGARSWILPTLIGDAVVVALAGAVALLGRQAGWLVGATTTVTGDLSLVAPLVLVGWMLAIALVGGYRSDVQGAGSEEYGRVARATVYAGAAFGFACYVTDYDLSRGFFLLLFGVGLPGLLVVRFGLRRALHRARREGLYAQRIVICGDAAHVDDIARVLQRDTWLGYHVVGAVLPAGTTMSETPAGVPVLGTTADLTTVTAQHEVDVAFFAGGAAGSARDMRATSWALERAGVGVVLAPSINDISSERVRVHPVGGMPLVHVDPPTWADASRWGKRAFDIAGSSVLLFLLAPLLTAVALLVKLDDGGPILFRQTRVGRNGREFGCFKVRSMVTDAEQRLAQLHAEVGFDGGLFKMADDPRITRPGRWIRRLSIDELPQLLNVLRGEMSLIGPRPPLPSEVEGYDAGAARRMWVRPGMTGLWQVSGRSQLSWDEAIRLDLYYVDNWSMAQDLTILAKTARAVLGGRGAY
ncbi:sugar transferase [Nocardioides aquaticus]